MNWVIWIPIAAGIIGIGFIIEAIIWCHKMDKVFDRIEKQQYELEKRIKEIQKRDKPSTCSSYFSSHSSDNNADYARQRQRERALRDQQDATAILASTAVNIL